MNRYVARGLLLDAAAHGRRVVVISATARECRAAFDLVAGEAVHFDGGVNRVLRAYGAERIEMCSGGRLVFLNASGQARGHSADIAFLDGPDAAAKAGVDACVMVNASPHGEVIRA